MSKPDYKAFISYSHSDERWALWLHRALESYRVPGKLVGTQTPRGEVPKQLRPIFRDRDDLSSSSDLSTTVKETLANSENLIVICSPNAAASNWANEEIREFVRLGRQSQIFCVIVDGDPASTDPGTRCFPAALAEAGLHEPLAADVRKWADGKYLSKLKLIAGILGLPLDQLRRRELQKRRKVRALTAVALVAVAAVLIAAVWFQISAQQRRTSGESLVAVKLNQLRTLLNVKEDPENLHSLDEWNNQDLKKVISAADTGEVSLIDSAMELRKQGMKTWQDGAIETALETFRQSWALIAESYRRNREDPSVLFELGQAEYWIGHMHLIRGELDQADHYFMPYAEITRRLILQQPENDEWVLEMSYALTNLGGVERARGESDPVRALQLMQSALEYNQLALVLDPTSTYYRSELGQSNANLADAQRDVCDLEGALETQQENVTLQSALLKEDPSNLRRMSRLAFALSGHSKIQQMMGRLEESKPSLEQSLQLLQQVLIDKPGDQIRQRQVLERKQRLAWQDAMSGNTDQAWKALNAIEEEWQVFSSENGSDDLRTLQAYSIYLLNRAWIARDMGDLDLAEEKIIVSLGLISTLMSKLPDSRNLGNLLTQATFQYWEIENDFPPSDIMRQLPDYNSGSGRVRACTDASVAVRKAVMMDDMAYAGELTNYLLDRGYGEAGFVRVCKAYSLCVGQ
jgi:tetratricopeptide (TPR) repeat protein